MFGSAEIERLESLRAQNMQIKKDVNHQRSENQSLKVRIRKLTEELSKKDRQINNLMDPKKLSALRRQISDNGATMLMHLMAENEKQKKKIFEKDVLINKLSNELKAANVYYVKSIDKRKQENEVREKNLETESRCSSSGNLQRAEAKWSGSKITSDEKLNTAMSALGCSELEQLYENLRKIKDNSANFNTEEEKSNDTFLTIIRSIRNSRLQSKENSPRLKSSASHSEGMDLVCDTPHEEIQKLQNYFLEMLTEVEELKLTIHDLHSQQRKTSNLLHNKENSIEKLAEEIKALKSIAPSQIQMKKRQSKNVQQIRKHSKTCPSHKSGSVIILQPVNTFMVNSDTCTSRRYHTEIDLCSTTSKRSCKRPYPAHSTSDCNLDDIYVEDQRSTSIIRTSMKLHPSLRTFNVPFVPM